MLAGLDIYLFSIFTQAKIPFPHPLLLLETRFILIFSGGTEMEHWLEIGEYINPSHDNVPFLYH